MAGAVLKVPEKCLCGHQSNLGAVSCSWPGGKGCCSSLVVIQGESLENARCL